MTREELLARLRDHEDNFVERKLASSNRHELRKTMVAFANSVPEGREGILFIGVGDSGQIEGCQASDKTQKTVREICEADCYPAIKFASEVLQTDKGIVVAVIIPMSQDRPHFSGPAYIRRGSESVAASPQIFEELVLSRTSKIAAILKLKNQVVTIVSLGHELGRASKDVPSDFRQSGECRILECDAHSVRFQMVGSAEYISEPLEHIKFLRDEKRHRPMIVVTGY